MKRVFPLLALTALVLAVLVAPASGKVPKFDLGQPSIVPGSAIGGVEVGMSKAEAKTVWGQPDSCTTSSGLTTCAYTLNSPIGPKYVAAFFVKKNRVVAIELDTPENAVALAKVHRLKTAKGIKIGSLIETARAKYGIAKTGAGEANESRADLKKGNRCTEFFAPEKPYARITSITVGICKSVISLYF